ncbi:BTAD domain-containing putative transcriptional regulator [Streptomyces sp. H39-S7]|uniref:BTAD domain-containing putative transcriptional regulator n=1 Tax=Streptomyces sp. H39-S7 TaxID=3004357 RepID=UPI0022B02601|nr:BTAD domain-containing putative transcriptional regulator [Streptomyces sp. H39-S7]MCZ4117939.1 BTAD domain-containing putative transcriptional regulator [Streptomyces sp. H39-S7]
MVCIRVLGSFGAERDGEPVPLGGRRQRSVLALLVAARGQVVPVDRMVDDLWQDAAPAQAVTSLQAYVSNLRRLLEPGRAPRTPAKLLVSAPPGYALRLPEDAVDAWRFERLLHDARDVLTTRPRESGRLLEEALSLWQGPAYAEAADEPWARAETARLEELRRSARELRIAAGLRSGAASGAVPEAELLTRDEPLREEGWRLHALALWAAGRQADALATLRRARAVLAAEVGLDPGAALTELEEAVLAQRVEVLRAATDAPPGALGEPRPPAGPGQQTAESDLFVGRASELELLAAAADRALRAGPGVALVTGEAGMGKSALLERFGHLLRRDGWLVALGRTTDAEGAPPAWAWAEALRTVAAELPPPSGTAAELAPLLSDAPPDGSPTGPLAQGDTAVGRFRLHQAARQWLETVAAERPVAVMLDDLHWADAETLAMLTGLVDMAPGARVLFVAAYRPDELGGPLTDGLAALARRSPLRVPLRGLSGPAVAEVIGAVTGAAGEAPVDAETLASLAERTGGNPFYVRESARLLGSEGALVALSDVPEGVRDVLRRRLGRLPEAAVALLRLAAVAGREADVEVLVGAADTGEDGVLGALETGLVAGLLTEPAPGRVRFAHALVRDTLLADLSRLRATRMHGRIAASLELLAPDDVSALAHHHARAASSATAAKAVDYCVRAAALAEGRYAHDVAAVLLGQALECFERVPAGGAGDRDGERIDLLGRRLRAQVRAGAVMEARATRRTAVDLATAAARDDLLIRAFTAWTEPTPWQSRPYGMIDGPVVTALGRLLERPDLEPAVRCRLLDAYCGELSDGQDPRARAAAEEAVEIADRLGDPALRALALATLARELDTELEWRERASVGERIERIGREHDLPVHRWFGLCVRSTAAAVGGDVAGAHRLNEQCLELARAYRMPGPVAVGETMLATFAHIEGRAADAERLYAEAAARMGRQGSPHADGYLLIATATIRAGQGRRGEFVPQARGLFDDYGPMACDLLAASLAAAGLHAEARQVLAQVPPIRPDYFFKVFATFRAMAMVALGEKEGAAELYAALLPYGRTPPLAAGSTVAIRPVAYTLGELAGLLGRDEEAAVHFARADAIAELWNTTLGRTTFPPDRPRGVSYVERERQE